MDINHSLLGWLGFFLIFFWEQTTVTKMYCSREYVTFLIDPKFLKVYSLLIWNQLKKSKTLPHKITKAVDWCVSPEDIFLWINLRTIPVMREDGLFMYVQILHTQQDNFHFWLALPQGILKLMRKKCYGKKKKKIAVEKWRKFHCLQYLTTAEGKTLKATTKITLSIDDLDLAFL